MCQKTTCGRCGKATWSGCGQHVDQALAGVPQSARCQGHESEKPRNLFASLFGR